MEVVQAANFAGIFASEVILHCAFASLPPLLSVQVHQMMLMTTLLSWNCMSFEHGKACGNPAAVIYEEFCLAAKEYITSNAFMKSKVNLTAEMFCQ